MKIQRKIVSWLVLFFVLSMPLNLLAECNGGKSCGVPAPVKLGIQPVSVPGKILVTPGGQPDFRIKLAALACAGPAVNLGIAYVPGYTTPWIGEKGQPLLGEGWRFTFPCIVNEEEQADPETLVLVNDGNKRIIFQYNEKQKAFTSCVAVNTSLVRSGGKWLLEDTFGGRVVFAGFSSNWSEAVKGKPLLYEDPFFTGDRGVRFDWSHEGSLKDITDSAGRKWDFIYDAGRVKEIVITMDTGFPLYTILFHYEAEGMSHGNLVSVETSLPGVDGLYAKHVFRYYGEGFQEGFLQGAMGPEKVAGYGGIQACLELSKEIFLTDADVLFEYDTLTSQPKAIVSRARFEMCSSCSGAESGYYSFSYSYNPDRTGINEWSTQLIQETPDGTTVYTDYNKYGRLLNWGRMAFDNEAVLEQFASVKYDEPGRIVQIVYPTNGYSYNKEKHCGVLEEHKGRFKEGLVKRFLYDYEGRVTEEQINRTSSLENPATGWVTIRKYGYKGEIHWPAKIIQYPQDRGKEITTEIKYHFAGPAGEFRLCSKDEQFPAEPVEENGSGKAATRSSFYDLLTGQLVKEISESGIVTTYVHDETTGKVIRKTVDEGDLNLTTEWFYDPWNRIVEKKLPNDLREVRFSAPLEEGKTINITYKAKGERDVAPVLIEVVDLDGNIICRAKGVPADGLRPEEAVVPGAVDISESWNGSLSERENYIYSAGRLWRRERLLDANGVTSVCSVEEFFYDQAGRLRKTIDADGTVKVFQFDPFGRKTRIFMGLDRSESDLSLIEKRYYDSSGFLIGVRSYREDPEGGEENEGAMTEYVYDWRGRMIQRIFPGGSGEERRALKYVYGNMDQLLEIQERPAGRDTWHLKESRLYDSRGRIWGKSIHNRENASEKSVEYYWYNPEGKKSKTLFAGGAFRKDFFDGAGRLSSTFIGYDPGETEAGAGESYEEATSPQGLSNDIVLESEEYKRDKNGKVALITHCSRKQDSEAKGPLVPAVSGRSRQAAFWYTDSGKEEHLAIYSAEAPLYSQRPEKIPFIKDTVLRTDFSYDLYDRLHEVRTPDGKTVAYEYDNLGRQVSEINNYIPNGKESDQNIKVSRVFDGKDRMIARRVETNSPLGKEARETKYIYGVRKDDTYPSLIASGNFLREIRHPDPVTGNAGTKARDIEYFSYDGRGQVIRHRSCANEKGNAVEHQYEYDDMERLVTDSVTESTAGTDNSIQSLSFGYDKWDRLDLVTAYALPWRKGEVLNEVALKYNGFDQLVSEAQEHNGKCKESTKRVGYTWSEMSAGDELSRLKEIIYPVLNGKAPRIKFLYSGKEGADSSIVRADWLLGRVSEIDASFMNDIPVASYKYEGISRIVERESFTLWPGFSLKQKKTDDGFDRTEGIKTDLSWIGHSLLRLQDCRYLYDEEGRMTVKSDRSYRGSKGDDWLCMYDGIGRLSSAVKGKWRQGFFSGVNETRSWELSGTGNWSSLTVDGKTENRLHNARDQIVESDSTDNALSKIHYDCRGNTISADGETLTYDAWNSLTGISSSGKTVSIERDGLGRIIQEQFYANGENQSKRNYYYKNNSQVVSVFDETNGKVIREDYAWGIEHEDEILLRHRDASNVEENLFYIQDALRNVTTVCNGLGIPVERYLYTPFGSVKILDGLSRMERDKSLFKNRIMFHGHWSLGPGRLGSESDRLGLYDFRNRTYSSGLGRFLQKDKIRLPYKNNLYAAPFGDSFLDPSGLKPVLRNCSDIFMPLVDVAVGFGLVVGADIDVSARVCDCCKGNKNKWIESGWRKVTLHAESSVGFGAALSTTILGLHIGAELKFAQYKPIDCSASGVLDGCGHGGKVCLNCGKSLSVGAPVFSIGGLVGSLSGTAVYHVSAGLNLCMNLDGIEGNWELCRSISVYIEIRVFFWKKRFIFKGRKKCLKLPI